MKISCSTSLFLFVAEHWYTHQQECHNSGNGRHWGKFHL